MHRARTVVIALGSVTSRSTDISPSPSSVGLWISWCLGAATPVSVAVVSGSVPAMSGSVFTKIITGEFPGRFVWRDDDVVAFLTIAPIRPGHVLVVPVREVDKWTDLDPSTWARLNEVALHIGRALESSFACERVGTIIAGLEVPHCHMHLIPIDTMADLDFAKADASASAEALDESADRIRGALRAAGHAAAG